MIKTLTSVLVFDRSSGKKKKDEKLIRQSLEELGPKGKYWAFLI